MPLIPRLRRSLQTSVLAWHIARRYLFSRERQALEWVVTLISIAGVAVGVGTIIAVFGVIDGMREKILGEITADYPSLRIFPLGCHKQALDPELLALLRRQPGVVAAEPVLSQNAMMVVDKNWREFVQLYATDGLAADNIFNVQVPKGTVLRPEPRKILLAFNYDSARLSRGQAVTVISDATIRTALYPVPKARRLEIQGTFAMANSFIGRHVVFASWADVRDLALCPAGIDYIHVKLADPLAAEAVKARLLKILPPKTTIHSWTESFEQMFTDMKILSVGMLLVMLMTMLVAALNIIGTLTLIVIQKTREIGILKTMGASRRLVGRIFLAEGALVGLLGAALGVALGIVFCLLLQRYKVPVPGNLFGQFKTIPAQLSPWTVVLTGGAAVVISTLAALAPAWRAGGLKPVEALRHE